VGARNFEVPRVSGCRNVLLPGEPRGRRLFLGLCPKRFAGVSPASNHVLLTGGAGFIGSHISEALLRRGFQLSVVDSLDDFYSPAAKRANLEEVRRVGDFCFCELDLCDFDALRQTISKLRPDTIIHLAARAGVRPSIETPQLYERVNVGATVNLLELARQHGVKRFIFGSSSSVYGVTNRVPFVEDDPNLRPISPYAATKLAGEFFCHTYAHLYGLSVVCLRFFTVYGPRQRPDLAIRKFATLMEAGKPIPVFGDGSMGRDYTFVDDIVAGVLAALDYQFPAGTPFDIFNLGNSHPVTLNQLIETLERVTGRSAIRDQRELQPGDVPITWADTSKAARLLGYRPATPLVEGLEKFVHWLRHAQS
jgi:UDP-glucuronate 4-epimerase